MGRKHIVWDWNGTLFHDIQAVVDATNEVFKPYGLCPLDPDGYREVYTRPIWVAYERLLGRPLRDGEWEELDRAFHDHYHRLMDSCGLTDGALDMLAGWAESGTQSLLSMWTHDRLVAKAAELGIDHHFARIDGLRAGTPGGLVAARGAGAQAVDPGGHKAEHMAAHIAALGVNPEHVVVIGDSVDDAHAAEHVGARAILYTGGMTRRAALEASGHPVVDSLAEAIELAGP